MNRQQPKSHVAILPTEALAPSNSASSSSDAAPRFLRLPHPRTLQSALFLPYKPAGKAGDAVGQTDGLLEVQKIYPTTTAERCWFVEESIISDGSLTVMTPYDPLFTIIALLLPLPPYFLSLVDLWESISLHEYSETDIEEDGSAARFGAMECVLERLMLVCDSQEHDGVKLYRFSAPKVLAILRTKITNLIDPTLGIFGALESTELGGMDTESSKAQEESVDERLFPTVSRGLGREGVGDGKGVSETIQLETRTKYALQSLGNYLPPPLLLTLFESYAFPALTIHLASSTTSSVLSSTYLPGRASSNPTASSSGGNGFGAAAAAAKKRKAETKGSMGVEALKKVSTRGMSKLESFFGPPKSKAAGVKVVKK